MFGAVGDQWVLEVRRARVREPLIAKPPIFLRDGGDDKIRIQKSLGSTSWIRPTIKTSIAFWTRYCTFYFVEGSFHELSILLLEKDFINVGAIKPKNEVSWNKRTLWSHCQLKNDFLTKAPLKHYIPATKGTLIFWEKSVMYSNNFDYSDLGWLVRSADNKNESKFNRRKFLESRYIEQK